MEGHFSKFNLITNKKTILYFVNVILMTFCAFMHVSLIFKTKENKQIMQILYIFYTKIFVYNFEDEALICDIFQSFLTIIFFFFLKSFLCNLKLYTLKQFLYRLSTLLIVHF